MSLFRKQDVRVHGISGEINFAITMLGHLIAHVGYRAWITSVSEGRHSDKSLHYLGRAFDFGRIKQFSNGAGWIRLDPAEIDAFAVELREQLGPDFDVIVEGDHIHVEWDPKGRLA